MSDDARPPSPAPARGSLDAGGAPARLHMHPALRQGLLAWLCTVPPTLALGVAFGVEPTWIAPALSPPLPLAGRLSALADALALDPTLLAVSVSALSLLAASILAWLAARTDTLPATADRAPWLLLAAPTALAATRLPEVSLALACMLGAWYAARRGSFVIASLLACVPPLLVPGGFAIWPPLVLEYLFARGWKPSNAGLRGLALLAPVALFGALALVSAPEGLRFSRVILVWMHGVDPPALPHVVFTRWALAGDGIQRALLALLCAAGLAHLATIRRTRLSLLLLTAGLWSQAICGDAASTVAIAAALAFPVPLALADLAGRSVAMDRVITVTSALLWAVALLMLAPAGAGF